MNTILEGMAKNSNLYDFHRKINEVINATFMRFIKLGKELPVDKLTHNLKAIGKCFLRTLEGTDLGGNQNPRYSIRQWAAC